MKKGSSFRRTRKRKILIIKIIMLCLFLGGFAGLFIYMGMHILQKEPAGPVVCIDPGHGGIDVGAIGSDSRYEKDDNLRLALAVKEALKGKNINVVMTRDDDTKVSLEDRCYIANKEKATLFVSIHRNSAERESANGVEIWTAKKGRGTQMATYILEGLREAGIQKDRGVQSGTSDSGNSEYYVNRHTTMPSCLIEMGFITNEEDNRLLDEKLQGYAGAIAEGIEKMLLDMETEEE